MRLDQLDQDTGAEQEDARVPIKSPGVEIALGGFPRRLLHEALDLPYRAVALGLDIAIARMRAVGRDAEGDEAARSRRYNPGRHRRRERVPVGDHMVRRREQHRAARGLPRPRSARRCRPRVRCSGSPARARCWWRAAPNASSCSAMRKPVPMIAEHDRDRRSDRP